MKSFKMICAAALLMAGFAMSATAQDETEKDYEYAPYTFVGIQGGVQNTLNPNYNNWKTFTPTAAVSIGHFFSPVVGLRANVNGIWSKGCATAFDNSKTDYFNYKYVTTSADVLVNLCTLFGKKEYYPVNLYFIGGLGWYHAWDNDEALDLFNGTPCYNINNVTADKRDAFNGRLGLQLEVNLCKNVAFNVEGTYNLHAGQHHKFTTDNQQLVLLAGFNFKFGYKHKKAEVVEEVPAVVAEPEPVYETRYDTIWYDDVTYKDVYKDGDIDKRIFFNVGGSDVQSTDSQIAEVAEFLKGVQNGEITVTSYADKGTGTPKKNMQYSRTRAEKTVKALTEKGVSNSMIKSVNWKGDTVQPYPDDNDKNRVSIITGHGVYKQQEKVVTKKFRVETKQVRVN